MCISNMGISWVFFIWLSNCSLVTFFLITPEIFLLETSNSKHMHLCILCKYMSNMINIPYIFYIRQSHLLSCVCQYLLKYLYNKLQILHTYTSIYSALINKITHPCLVCHIWEQYLFILAIPAKSAQVQWTYLLGLVWNTADIYVSHMINFQKSRSWTFLCIRCTQIWLIKSCVLGRAEVCASGNAYLVVCVILFRMKCWPSIIHMLIYFTLFHFLLWVCISRRISFHCGVLFVLWLLLWMLFPITGLFIFSVLICPCHSVVSGQVLCKM